MGRLRWNTFIRSGRVEDDIASWRSPADRLLDQYWPHLGDRSSGAWEMGDVHRMTDRLIGALAHNCTVPRRSLAAHRAPSQATSTIRTKGGTMLPVPSTRPHRIPPQTVREMLRRQICSSTFRFVIRRWSPATAESTTIHRSVLQRFGWVVR